MSLVGALVSLMGGSGTLVKSVGAFVTLYNVFSCYDGSVGCHFGTFEVIFWHLFSVYGYL